MFIGYLGDIWFLVINMYATEDRRIGEDLIWIICNVNKWVLLRDTRLE